MLLASLVLAIVVVVLWRGGVALATPTVVYRMDRRFDLASTEFETAVAQALDARLVRGNRITRFEDGSRFYPQMLADISAATHTRSRSSATSFIPAQPVSPSWRLSWSGHGPGSRSASSSMPLVAAGCAAVM